MKKLFEYISKHIEGEWNDEIIVKNKEVSKEKLIILVNEGVENYSIYPDDKMFRWLGYLSGVLTFYEIPLNMNFLNVKKFERKPLEGESEAIIKIVNDFYIPTLKNNNEKIFLENIIQDEGILKKHFLLGVYQGYKIANKELDVKEERDRTRPLLHSYRKEKIRSFG